MNIRCWHSLWHKTEVKSVKICWHSIRNTRMLAQNFTHFTYIYKYLLYWRLYARTHRTYLKNSMNILRNYCHIFVLLLLFFCLYIYMNIHKFDYTTSDALLYFHGYFFIMFCIFFFFFGHIELKKKRIRCHEDNDGFNSYPNFISSGCLFSQRIFE